jgi:hypothetical protein
MKYNKFYIQEVQNLPVEVIAAYVVLKRVKRNSVIYNFTYSKLKKLTGIHITTLKKIVKLVLNHKLAEITKEGHLQLVSKTRILQEKKAKRTKGHFYISSKKFVDVKNEIREVLVKSHFRKMQFRHINSASTFLMQAKRKRFILEKQDVERQIPVEISTYRIGELIDLSQSQASKFMKSVINNNGWSKKQGRMRAVYREMIKRRIKIAPDLLEKTPLYDCNVYFVRPILTLLDLNNKGSI